MLYAIIDGTFSGGWQVRDKDFPGFEGTYTVHGNVTCFTILLDGIPVLLGGVVEKNDFGFLEGSEANWTIVDKGKDDLTIDLLTFGWSPGSGVAEYNCETGQDFNNIPPTPIVRVNVKVKP